VQKKENNAGEGADCDNNSNNNTNNNDNNDNKAENNRNEAVKEMNKANGGHVEGERDENLSPDTGA
jgi:hypothetical protein